MQRQETWVATECAACGVTFQQRDDAGRRREFCTRACRQRAYRARTGRDGHEARRERTYAHRQEREDRQRRAWREAWAEQEQAKEQDRQKKHEKRHGAPPPPPASMPSWCFDKPGDSRLQREKRKKCYRMMYRAMRPTSSEDWEAAAFREAAEEIRAKYRL